MRLTVPVALGDRAYPVHVDDGDLSGLGEALRAVDPRRRVVVVSDTNVDPLWGDAAERSLRDAKFGVQRVVLPAGEEHKTLNTWAMLLDRWFALSVDRHTLVIALGGGVIGDLAGFAAATALRGLDFVQVPTTLLAMVDSSVGGKTGVNHPRGKNLVGAFHQPRLVYAALRTLDTLGERERRSGFGEIVKTAVVADSSLLATLEREGEALAAGDPGALLAVVARCVEIKADIVASDERESGRRAILNFGHTVGHALEAALGFGALLHGEAVGLGMVAEASWAVSRGWCREQDLPERIQRVLDAFGLPVSTPEVSREALGVAMGADKKANDVGLRIPVPVRAGETVAVDLARAEFDGLLSRLP